MKILERLRNRSRDGEAAAPHSAEASSVDMNATTEIAATCEQRSHASSPRHGQVPSRIGRATRRPRSSKQAFGPARATSCPRRARPR